MVSYFVGERSEQSCKQLWAAVPTPYKVCGTFSEFWEAYGKIMDSNKHQMVGKQTGATSHVERWNNTLRQRMGRFVRKTLSFSKCDVMHQLYLKLFIYNYNISLKT